MRGPTCGSRRLRHNIRRVDAILFTHGHADHIFGLDETRRFTGISEQPLPCYGDAQTLSDIRKTFALRLRSGDAERRRPAGAAT